MHFLFCFWFWELGRPPPPCVGKNSQIIPYFFLSAYLSHYCCLIMSVPKNSSRFPKDSSSVPKDLSRVPKSSSKISKDLCMVCRISHNINSQALPLCFTSHIPLLLQGFRAKGPKRGVLSLRLCT